MPRKPPIWQRVCNTEHTPQNYWGRNNPKPSMTVERALAVLDAGKRAGLVGVSKINKVLTKKQSHDILFAPVSMKKPDTIIDSMIAKNIGREFGHAYLKETAK